MENLIKIDGFVLDRLESFRMNEFGLSYFESSQYDSVDFLLQWKNLHNLCARREIIFSGKLQLIFDGDRNDPIVKARSGGGDGAGFHITENYCFYDGFRSLFTLFMMSI